MNPRILEEGLKRITDVMIFRQKGHPLWLFFQTHIESTLIESRLSGCFSTSVLEKMIFFVLSCTNNHLLRSETKLVRIPSRLSIRHVRVFICFF
jgi:hypothetical protein